MSEPTQELLQKMDEVRAEVAHKAERVARQWCQYGQEAANKLESELFGDHRFTLAEKTMFKHQVTSEVKRMVKDGPTPGLSSAERIVAMNYRFIQSVAPTGWFWIQGDVGEEQVESNASFTTLTLAIDDAYEHSLASVPGPKPPRQKA